MKLIAITPDKKRDYTTELTLEGLRDLGCDVVASNSGNGIEKCASDETILNTKDAHGVLSFFGKVRDNNPPKYYLLRHLKDRYKIAHIDGSEWTSTGYPNKNQLSLSLENPLMRRGQPWLNEEMMLLSDFYFKRECYPEDLSRGIIPLPFCLSKRHLIERKDKDIDVMCVFGHLTTGLRSLAFKVCHQLREKTNYRIVVTDKLRYETYTDVLSRSRIVIDAWGGGDNCDRFYEAVGANACCLYQKYNVVVENPFKDFETAVSYWDEESFIDRLQSLLSSKDLCYKIANNGIQHAKEHHTASIRAKRILDKL